jgi:MerR family transcriptional regulator, redox-sensitive transcriptional activator SoxR
MYGLSISQVARRFGLRSSALRYYEQIGILGAVNRVSGQRRYDEASLRRLAVIQRAREAGFALEDIRELFAGFRPGVPASQRWRQVSQRKLTEIEDAIARLAVMKDLLQRMGYCRCDALDECGAAILRTVDSQPRAGAAAPLESQPEITRPSAPRGTTQLSGGSARPPRGTRASRARDTSGDARDRSSLPAAPRSRNPERT